MALTLSTDPEGSEIGWCRTRLRQNHASRRIRKDFATRFLRLTTCALLALSPPFAERVEPATAPGFPTRHVVLVYDERTELPGLAMLDSAIQDTLRAESPEPLEIYRVSMDLSRFESATYETQLRDFLDAQFEGKKVDAVVGVMGPAIDFLLRHRDTIFPGAPIVFCGLDQREYERRQLPPGTTGVLLDREFAPTLDLALQIHPDTRRVVFVGGTGEFDSRLVEKAREQLQPFESRVELRYLTELPMAQLLEELGRLPPHTLILYSTLFRDGAGEAFVPHEVVKRISAVANAPVYGFLDQYMGLGMVGGRLYGLGEDGAEAARLVLRILAGADPSALPVSSTRRTTMAFDWNQMQRWRIRASSLPPEAVIRFRPPSLWNQYRGEVIAALLLVILQALLISGLLVNRSRRRRAEAQLRESELRAASEMQRSRMELAHVARVATIGEFSASVAHELRQPLGAILANAAAAQIVLAREGDCREQVKEILEDISADDRRASDILARMRALLAKHEFERQPLALNETAKEVLRLLSIEAAERKCAMSFEPDDSLPRVAADRVHLQQVLMNLVLNGLEAMGEVPEDERRLIVRTCRDGDLWVKIAVTDRGHGIPPDYLAHLFDPFWTTKPGGLGMGLSIARSIIEAHQGRIWAANEAGAGATFHVVLPALEPTVH